MEAYTEVFTWGGDHFGQLGLGSKHSGKTYPSPRFCSFNITIKEISCGEEHSGFISISNHVYCMGSNSEGRLGVGDKSLRSSSSPCLVEALTNFKSIRISCGWGHSAVVTDDGQLFTWGVGEFGALGNSTSENQWTPSRVVLPKGVKVLDVNCGSRHTGIVAEDSRTRHLMMTGSGEAGQLGTGKREKEFRFVQVSVGDDVQQVACGVFHSLVLTSSGKVLAMGGNSFGQLGNGSKKSSSRPERVLIEGSAVKVACGSHSAAINDRGLLFVWGTGVFGEYLTPTRLPVAMCKDISIGGNFGIALDLNGELFAWGANSNGELGVGDNEPRLSPTLVTQLKGKHVKKISAGGNYVIALGNTIGESRMNFENQNESVRTGKREESLRRSEAVRRNNDLEKVKSEVENKDRVKDKMRESEELRSSRNDRVTPLKYSRGEESRIERQLIEKTPNPRGEARSYKDPDDLKKSKEYKPESRSVLKPLENQDSDYTSQQANLTSSLRYSLEDSQRQNSYLSSELKSYKEEVQRLKKQIEDIKQTQSLDTIQKIEDLNQNLQNRHQIEIQDLKLTHEQEQIRRRQAEKNLDVSSKHISNLEEALQRYSIENSDLKKQLLEANRNAESFRINAQQDLDRAQDENSELRRKIDSILNEKERIESSLTKEVIELKRKYESLLLDKERREDGLNEELQQVERRNESILMEKQVNENNFNREIQDLRRKVDRIVEDKDRNEAQLNAELADSRRRLESTLNEKERAESGYKSEISVLTSKLTDFQLLINNLTSENSQINSLFTQETGKSQQEIQDYRSRLGQVIHEKDSKISLLQSQIYSLNSDLASAKSSIEDYKLELDSNATQLSSYSIQISNLSSQVSELTSSLNYSQNLLEDLKNVNSKHQQDSHEHNMIIERLKLQVKQWESDYSMLLDDNRLLKESVADLEMKNRQLFENLEKELAQRAKEYKDRTISILNTGRSVSPYMRNHLRDRSADFGASESKIDTEHSPNFARNSKYQTIAQCFKGTPTKEDVRTRIASLMRNREKIEEQLCSIDDE